jgi:hypothetical protein
MHTSKIAFSNESNRPRIIWIEPWGADFTLLNKEEIEIVVTDAKAVPWFHVLEHDDCSQVYVEGVDLMNCRHKVLQGEKELQIGHNRQHGIDAGFKY